VTVFARSAAVAVSVLIVCFGAGISTSGTHQTRPRAEPPPLSVELPALPSMNPALPTLFLVGDSTVKVGTPGQMGWGDAIGAFFDTSRLNIVNYARGGRSSRTFLTEGLWNRVLSAMKPGDFVLVQFGHNDGGELFETTRPRGSLPGTGDGTREGVVAMTGRFEVVRTFGWYLKRFAADARERDATAIICSLVPRNIWKNGRIVRDERAAWARDAARAAVTPFLDLNDIVARRYEEVGEAEAIKFFAGDHTHTNAAGALYNAGAVVEGLRAMRSPLTNYLLDPSLDTTRTTLGARETLHVVSAGRCPGAEPIDGPRRRQHRTAPCEADLMK
jgi:lysophospholipase L1-like esterase